MPFVRIDLQLTEDEGDRIATVLERELGGFASQYHAMKAEGTSGADTHYQILYRSKVVQAGIDADGG